jgi:hypothetical protein
MKLFLCISVLLSFQLAKADSFTIIRDGNEYLCEQQGSPLDPGGNLECNDKAYSGPFSRDEAQRLCEGSHTDAPADCGIRAYNGPFSKDESIQLCIRARSTGPADCAIKAYGGPFSKDESLQLCSLNGSTANADCAIKAYAGPYSKEEAIRMCKSQPLLVMRSLALIEQSQDLKPKVESIKFQLLKSAVK